MFSYTHRKTIALLLFILSLWGCGSGGNTPETADISDINIHLPVDVKLVHGTLFVVRVTVNESLNLDMLVDTGSSKTYVPAEIFGNTGGSVHITSLCFENDVCIYNFNALSSNSGFTQSKAGYFNGIIGIDLLKNFDLTLDYKNELLCFWDSVDNASSGLVMVPIHWESGRPFTTVLIEGILQGRYLLDTGAAYTRLTASILDSLSQHPEVLFTSVSFNFDVSEIVEYVPLNEYCIGTACSDELIVQIGSWPAVGGTFFNEYVTTFNFNANVVKLDRYSDASHIKPSGIQRIGLQVNIRDASEIVYVREGSVAWQAGLKEGDQIISANGIPIASLGYFGLYDLLSDTAINDYQLLVSTPTDEIESILLSVN